MTDALTRVQEYASFRTPTMRHFDVLALLAVAEAAVARDAVKDRYYGVTHPTESAAQAGYRDFLAANEEMDAALAALTEPTP